MAIGRVGTRAAFTALLQRGVRARHGVVRLTWLPPEPADTTSVRVAYAIGRPIGTAVVRNRVRRRLRAAVTELSPGPGTYLIGVTSAGATAAYQELRADLAAALSALASRLPAAAVSA